MGCTWKIQLPQRWLPDIKLQSRCCGARQRIRWVSLASCSRIRVRFTLWCTFRKSRTSDVIFDAGGEKFYAHKVVLAEIYQFLGFNIATQKVAGYTFLAVETFIMTNRALAKHHRVKKVSLFFVNTSICNQLLRISVTINNALPYSYNFYILTSRLTWLTIVWWQR